MIPSPNDCLGMHGETTSGLGRLAPLYEATSLSMSQTVRFASSARQCVTSHLGLSGHEAPKQQDRKPKHTADSEA